jgi:uncharacterized protein
MRVTLDTNVIISGIFFSGPPSKILKAWADQRFQLVLSQQILDEYQRVSGELSSKFPSIDIAPIIELITIHGLFIDTHGYTLPVCEDPDDNKFIECAVAGNCEIIISGDKHLLKLSEFRGIEVLSPRDFVDKYL